MAGMEQLEIHSKSYLVRWVNVKDEHTISWSIQPHKKSINFGIFKHPGSGIAPTPRLPSSTFEGPPTPGLKPSDGRLESQRSQGQSPSSAAIEKLTGIGLRLISWHGTCEANQVSSGTYDVPENGGGMYALVFDNTFAKSFSKTATFVLLTYPTNSAPSSNHQVHHIQGVSSGSTASLKLASVKTRAQLKGDRADSLDSVDHVASSAPGENSANTRNLGRRANTDSSTSSNFYTGVLQKRRRKRHQGYARRFFSLDFSSSTLSYYHNRHTLALRGAVPLSLAAIGANATTREISIDSGAEIWHLRAPNRTEFETWKSALELASRGLSHVPSASALKLDTIHRRRSGLRTNAEEEQDWAKVEAIVKRIAASRDLVCGLAKDTDPKYFAKNTSSTHLGIHLDQSKVQEPLSSGASSFELASLDEDSQNSDRRRFWKRKQSNGVPLPTSFRRSVSAQPAFSQPASNSTPADRRPSGFSRQKSSSDPAEDDVHERCMALLHNLDAAVADFTTLIAETKQRRLPLLAPSTSRRSIDSLDGHQEFFDAEGESGSQLLTIQYESDIEEASVEQHFNTDEQDGSSASESGDEDSFTRSGTLDDSTVSIFPSKAKSLNPLPLPQIERRSTVPPPVASPPSLIGFLRKNMGKDLSTISMPVSANEPISLLQRVSEQLEYSSLLDDAACDLSSSIRRLLCVTAFAVSSLSVLRVKDRAIRKPFNPMLGETFELVREDKGYRLISEKVSHRPVQMAIQAEAEKWSLNQSPLPTQQFWGKSAELITEGRVRVTLHETGDHFSWTPVTCFLRNIIAGEKYVEPVGTMTVTNETSGEHALVTFKTKGMFSGRSEEVMVQLFDSFGDELSTGLTGKWTQSLTVTENGNPRPKALWTVGELVPDAAKCYGFTKFTASLNEISPRDKLKIAKTDSRFRPDQRAAEGGDIEGAEVLKTKLEEAQRERRRILDEEQMPWQPMWFIKAEGREGEDIWKPKTGKDSYWERRAKGDWKGVTQVLAI